MNATIAASKETAPPGGSSVLDIPLERIRESTSNPRRVFDETKLRELADNIKLHGVLQAVLVRPSPDGAEGMYELVAGARRFRASKISGQRARSPQRYGTSPTPNAGNFNSLRICSAPTFTSWMRASAIGR